MAPEQISAYGLAMMRWGGNHTSRFNPEINAYNTGKDWFFMNRPSMGNWCKFEQDNREVGAASYVTIPTLGFVAKDKQSGSFSVKKYGQQQEVATGHSDHGNGRLPNGAFVSNNDWQDSSVRSTPEFVADGIRLVVRQAGDSPKPRYWALDNEPMLWHDTHRDVRQQPLGAAELWEKTVQYAEAIKSADPKAKIAGFCSWGWADLYYSALDRGNDEYRTFRRSSTRWPASGGVFIKKCGDTSVTRQVAGRHLRLPLVSAKGKR